MKRYLIALGLIADPRFLQRRARLRGFMSPR